MKRKILYLVATMVMLVSLVGACATPEPEPAPAPEPAPPSEPIVLRAVSFMPVGFKAVAALGLWADEVNRRANGELEIQWIGGPEVIGPFEQAGAVSEGAIDITAIPAGFYRSQLPEALTLMLSRVTPAVERERGVEEFMIELHREHLNAYFIGRTNFNYPFYMATSFPVSSPEDLAGRSAAASPLTTAFTDALGMIPIETEDEYTAMERGLVDAVIMPAVQHGDMSMFELETYFIDHGVLSGNVVILLNWDKWASLPEHLQDLLIQVRLDLEPQMAALTKQWTEEGRQAARDAGLTIVTFSPEDAESFVELSFSSAWEDAKPTLSPESYAKMREFLKK